MNPRHFYSSIYFWSLSRFEKFEKEPIKLIDSINHESIMKSYDYLNDKYFFILMILTLCLRNEPEVDSNRP